MRHEATFQTKFATFLRSAHCPPLLKQTSLFEYKSCEKYLPFSAVTKKEISLLLQVQGGVGVYHKMSDMSLGGTACDAFLIRDAVGWIPIEYRSHRAWVVLTIDAFLFAQKNVGRQSLTYEDALKYGSVHVIPKTRTVEIIL